MCGIFGAISDRAVDEKNLCILAMHSRQRGSDSSGLVYYDGTGYKIERADYDITQLLKKGNWSRSNVVMGHSRLITNGLLDNQPVVRDGLFVIHNGIIVNEEKIWESIGLTRHFQIDSEAIIAITIKHLDKGEELVELPEKILSTCEGTVSAAVAIPKMGKVLLFSNNGSLYVGQNESGIYFASERYPLERIACEDIKQIWREGLLIDIPETEKMAVTDDRRRKVNLIPKLKK